MRFNFLFPPNVLPSSIFAFEAELLDGNLFSSAGCPEARKGAKLLDGKYFRGILYQAAPGVKCDREGCDREVRPLRGLWYRVLIGAPMTS